MENKTMLVLRISKKLKTMLQEQANLDGVSVGHIVRNSIRDYFNNNYKGELKEELLDTYTKKELLCFLEKL